MELTFLNPLAKGIRQVFRSHDYFLTLEQLDEEVRDDQLLQEWLDRNYANRDEELFQLNKNFPIDGLDLVAKRRETLADINDCEGRIKKIYENSKSPNWLTKIFVDIITINELEPLKRKYKYWQYLINRQQNKITNKPIDLENIKHNLPCSELLSQPKETSQQRNKYLCPLHNEDTPSFVFYKKTNSFYCFGCHQGGNVIDLYMKLNQCDFKTAITELNKMI